MRARESCSGCPWMLAHAGRAKLLPSSKGRFGRNLALAEQAPTRPWPSWPVWGILLCLSAGCAADGPLIDRTCKCNPGSAGHTADIAKDYLLYCPDVIEVSVDSRPGLSGERPIGADGRIDLEPVGRLRIEGMSVAGAAAEIADALALPKTSVHVRVAEYKSQQIYLFGQVVGFQRAVAYQGPEPVTAVLERVGGITAGAATGSVYVVRPGLTEARQPEVFHVDLQAILVRHEQGTNIPLQPFDQIFVGETRPFSFEKCIPPILRPLYETVCGIAQLKKKKEREGRGGETRRQGQGETRGTGRQGERETRRQGEGRTACLPFSSCLVGRNSL